MKLNRSIVAAVVCAVLAGGAMAEAPRPQPTTRPGRGMRPNVPGNLEGAMESLDRNYKQVKAEAGDPAKREACLKLVAMMERDAAIAKSLPPMGKINKMPEAKRAELAEDYRTMMTGLIKSFMELEDAIADKKPEDAKKVIAEIDEMMKKGHEEFEVGEEKR